MRDTQGWLGCIQWGYGESASRTIKTIPASLYGAAFLGLDQEIWMHSMTLCSFSELDCFYVFLDQHWSGLGHQTGQFRISLGTFRSTDHCWKLGPLHGVYYGQTQFLKHPTDFPFATWESPAKSEWSTGQPSQVAWKFFTCQLGIFFFCFTKTWKFLALACALPILPTANSSSWVWNLSQHKNNHWTCRLNSWVSRWGHPQTVWAQSPVSRRAIW